MLSGRHALVTGGGTGIGAASARALAAAGARVTVAGIDVPSLETLAGEVDGLQWREMDVTDEAAVARVMGEVEPIDILVANAGIGEAAAVRDITLEHWRRVQAVNVEGVVLCMREAMRTMPGQGWGRIVTIASAAGLRGYEHLGAYAASKHAVVGLTRVASEELRGTGVTANAVCPMYTDTDMGRAAAARIAKQSGLPSAEGARELGKFNPAGRMLDADEVAAAVLWLCSPGASAINGQEIAVAGGQL